MRINYPPPPHFLLLVAIMLLTSNPLISQSFVPRVIGDMLVPANQQRIPKATIEIDGDPQFPSLPYSASTLTNAQSSPLTSNYVLLLNPPGIPNTDIIFGSGTVRGVYQGPITNIPKAGNGVNVTDITSIRSAILYTPPIDAWKRIAGDVNGDGYYSVFDLILLQKEILGITPNGFPAENIVFPTPADLTNIEQNIPNLFYNSWTGETEIGFIGLSPRADFNVVRLGDFNGDTNYLTAATGFTGNDDAAKSGNSEDSGPSFELFTPEQEVQSGKVVTVPVYASHLSDEYFLSLRLAMRPGAQLIEVEEGAIKFTKDNHQMTANHLSLIDYTMEEKSELVGRDIRLFTLKIQLTDAHKLGRKVSDLFQLEDLDPMLSIYHSKESGNETIPVSLSFSTDNKPFETAKASVFPSPFTDAINLQWESAFEEKLTVGISAISGRLVRTRIFTTTAGLNRLAWNDLADLKQGVYYLQIESDSGRSETIKIVK